MRRIIFLIFTTFCLWVSIIIFITIKEYPLEMKQSDFPGFLGLALNNIFSFNKVSAEEYRNIFLLFGGFVAYWSYRVSRDKLKLDELKDEREQIEFQNEQEKIIDSKLSQYIEMCSNNDNQLIRYAGFSGLFSILKDFSDEKYFQTIIDITRVYLQTNRVNDSLIESKILQELDYLMKLIPGNYKSNATEFSAKKVLYNLDSTESKINRLKNKQESSGNNYHCEILLEEARRIFLSYKLKTLKKILSLRQHFSLRRSNQYYIDDFTKFDLSGVIFYIPVKLTPVRGVLILDNAKFFDDVQISLVKSKIYSFQNPGASLKGVTVKGNLLFEDESRNPCHIEGIRVSGSFTVVSHTSWIYIENSKINSLPVRPGVHFSLINSSVNFNLKKFSVKLDGWMHNYCKIDDNSKAQITDY